MMYVPVEKVKKDFYEIEHVVEYMQREVIDMVPSIEPRETVSYKLQYVPVEKYIGLKSEKSSICLKVSLERNNFTQTRSSL